MQPASITPRVKTVLTLCADPAHRLLSEGLADAARRALDQAGASPGELDWLAGGVACDIPFDATSTAGLLAGVRAELGTAPVDAAIQPAAGRRKRLLVADMESTIIENEMLEELADLLGLRAPVTEITRRAMNGELDFAAALAERVLLLKGLPETALKEAGRRIRVTSGAGTLIRTMARDGAVTALVSGGFRYYTRRIAMELGFATERGNELEIRDGRITGLVVPPILGAEAKLQALTQLAAEAGVGVDAALAVGDGANDLPMLHAAGLGVAFRGKPAVTARADHRLDNADLTGLLYLQGYRHEEFTD